MRQELCLGPSPAIVLGASGWRQDLSSTLFPSLRTVDSPALGSPRELMEPVLQYL